MQKLRIVLLFFFFTLILKNNFKAQYIINGSAGNIAPGCYMITPDAATQVGSVWNSTLIDLNTPFDFTFNVYLGSNDALGADGICFGLQPLSTNIGVPGNGMGLGGVSPSLGVYIDTYQNSSPDNDPPEDHISINSNGDVNHASANNLAGPVPASSISADVEDNLNHLLRIQWNPSTQTFQVWFDAVLRLSYTGNIIANIFGGNPNVYWGFTGATGLYHNAQGFCILTVANFIANSGCFNNPIQFTDISNSGSPIISYAWDFGDATAPISGSGAAFQNPTHTFATAGSYTVTETITNSGGGISVVSHTIDILSPPAITSSNDTSICAGASATLIGTIGPGVPVPINFTSNAANSNVAIPDNFVLPGWTGNNFGLFATSNITVSGLLPGWSLASVIININHSYDQDLTAYLFNPCGNSIQLINSNGFGGANFSNTTFTPSATIPIGSGVVPFIGTYIPQGGAAAWNAFLTSSEGCGTANGTWYIRVGDHSAGVSGSVLNWNITFNNLSMPTYSWAPTGTLTNQNTLNPTVTTTVTTTYTLTSTNVLGCVSTSATTYSIIPLPTVTVDSANICPGTIAHLTANGATSYLWSAGATSTGTNTADASPLITTTYTVTGNALGCNSNAVSQVFVASLPITVNSVSICTGGAANLSASGATSYTWSAGVTSTGASTATASPAATTTYSVSGTTGTCAGATTFTVTVNAIPSVSVSPVTICTGENANLTANGATSYQWSTGSANNPLIVSPLTSTTYTVTGTTLNCSGSATVLVTVNNSVTITSNSGSICAKDTFLIIAHGATTYVWSEGIPSVTTDSLYVSPLTTTNYSITGNTAGCVGSTVSTLTVLPLPVPGFTAPYSTSMLTPDVYFTDNSSGASSWLWDFGDFYNASTNTSMVQNPMHTYSQVGTYCVKQTVEESGCRDTLVQCIVIEPEFTLYIPNAFTPNGNADNDEFYPKGDFIQDFQMKIFDRWGNIIFTCDDIKKHWDGSVNDGGEPVKDDVYVYIINVTDVNQKGHKYIGNVTLIK